MSAEHHSPLRIRPAGPLAILIEAGSLHQVMDVQALFRRERPAGVVDVVAAARTIMVRADSPRALRTARELLRDAVPHASPAEPPAIHTLKTVYDGADLAQAAGLVGLSPEALITWHAGQGWVAAFGGFAPGFMYLAPTEAAQALSFPRLASPRPVVPAGSVAVAGGFSAVYPGPTPGGWQLLGRCEAPLWDANRTAPALIRPGDHVHFLPAREQLRIGTHPVPAPPEKPEPEMPISEKTGTAGLRVINPGLHTCIQDLGRPGHAHLGVTASGALDRAALRRVNRMTGNVSVPALPGAAGLEVMGAGLALQAVGDHVLAITEGAVCAVISGVSGDRPAPFDAPFMLYDGERLTLEPAPPGTGALAPAGGLRSWIGVRGGIDVPMQLGSRSTDVLSGLGALPLRPGAFLPVAPAARGSVVGRPELPAQSPTEVQSNGITAAVLHFVPGPRDDWFEPDTVARFERQLWIISPLSNRIAVRLQLPQAPDSGEPLVRRAAFRDAELPSEGMLDGGIQVPPSGLPVLFLADHPVTGGYPVLGVVLPQDLGLAGRLAPGAPVVFRRVNPDA